VDGIGADVEHGQAHQSNLPEGDQPLAG
jgi:hypothetical protein